MPCLPKKKRKIITENRKGKACCSNMVRQTRYQGYCSRDESMIVCSWALTVVV